MWYVFVLAFLGCLVGSCWDRPRCIGDWRHDGPSNGGLLLGLLLGFLIYLLEKSV